MADHGLYEEDISALWGAQDSDVLQPAPLEAKDETEGEDPHTVALRDVTDTLRAVRDDVAALRREVGQLHEAVRAAQLWLPVAGQGSRSS